MELQRYLINITIAHDLLPISAAVPRHLPRAFQAEEEVVQEQVCGANDDEKECRAIE
jgi:hypothetical protein